MEGGGVAESQISASSVYYGILGLQRWGPELARLNNKGLVNAWTSATHDKNPWIEVNKSVWFTGYIHIWSSNIICVDPKITHVMTYLMLDQPAEEDAFHWHHYPGCQSHGHSRVHQSLQGGIQFGWANLHHVQT